MKYIGKILVTAIAAILAAYLLPGVKVAAGWTPVVLAIVLALLNAFVKPVLQILTIPITVFTLGLFLIVINIVIILLASKIVPGFQVHGWWSAFLFGILLSFFTYIIELLIGRFDKE